MHRMEGGAYAHATQYDTEGAQGTILYNHFASPEPQWVVAEPGVSSNAQFPFIGYGVQFGEERINGRGNLRIRVKLR